MTFTGRHKTSGKSSGALSGKSNLKKGGYIISRQLNKERFLPAVIVIGILFCLLFVCNAAVSAQQKVIVINPGHSIGYDSGATNETTGVTEAQVNQDLAGALVKKLAAAGYEVYITHTTDKTLSQYTLGTQAQGNSFSALNTLADSKNPDLVISIHHNSGGSSASGFELYWSSYRSYDTSGVYEVSGLWSDGSTAFRDSSPCSAAQESEKFAEILQSSFSDGKLTYRKTVERDDYLPAHSSAPCVLYEGGFISNNSESEYLNSQAYRDSASDCFLKAVNSYFGKTSSDTEAPTIDSFQSSCGQLPTTDAVITLTATGVADDSGVKSVKFPVWTSDNKQKDLIWYDAVDMGGGVWSVTIDISDYGGATGQYIAHVYTYDTEGNSSYRGMTTFTVTELTGIADGVSIVKQNETTASAYIKGLDGTGFKFAVWSEVNGQDDLKWVSTVRQTDGSYKAVIRTSDHNNDTGVYNVHAYSSSSGIKPMTVEFKVMSYTSLTISEPENGQFTITLNGVSASNGVKKILFPVWSANGGQDDLKWYTAVKNGDSYTATVNLKDHGWDTGTYYVHVYGTDNLNQQFFLSSSTVTVKTMEASTLTVTEPENGTFTVTLSGVSSPAGVNKILFPVWSANNGQDDLKWYTAVKQNGQYVCTISLKDHGYDTGDYNIHAYGIDSSGTQTFLKNITLNVPQMTASSVAVTESDSDSFTITVSGINAPNGVNRILIPVWSDVDGQDDLVWYTAQKSGDTYSVKVKVSDHNDDTGQYHIHVYGVDNNGRTQGLGSTYYYNDAADQTETPKLSVTADSNGKISIVLDGVSNYASIKFPVWSEDNGQDDLVWYQADKSGPQATCTVDIADHGSKSGVYYVHAYGRSDTGSYVGIASASVEVAAPASNSSAAEAVTTQTKIMGTSTVTADQLVQLYTQSGNTFPDYYTKRGVDLKAFAQMYIDEASAEGVRADIAFAQAMLETSYLQFTGSVNISQFNFAGLGAAGNGVTGEDFSIYGDNSVGIRMGIRAQIQHLKAYASTDPLNNEQVDSRFGYVTRGCAATIGQLSGTWAADTSYAAKIVAIIAEIAA